MTGVAVPGSGSIGSRILGSDFTGAALMASYVNGRLLSAADLSTDQQTLTVRDRRIGRASGAGVMDGLTVSASATTLTVAPGLGLTANGEPVVLNQSVSFPLAVPLAAALNSSPPAKFGNCDPGSTGSTGLVAAGSHVLTARPVSQSQGYAASAGPPGAVGSAGCVAAWTAAGIEFRVTALPVGTTVAGVAMTADNRRNLVATWCFGAGQFASVAIEPFDDPDRYGLQLTGVGADDLPLAVLAWDNQSIADLDAWSVRRRLTEASLGSDTWALLTSDTRISEGQARFRQFQDQIAELVRRQVASNTAARTTIPVLPPVGFLPIGDRDQEEFASQVSARLEKMDNSGGDNHDTRTDRWSRVDLQLIATAFAAPSGSGFGRTTFFGTSADFGGIIDFELAEFLLRESWYRPPVVLSHGDGDDGHDSDGHPPGWPDVGAPPGGIDPQEPDIPTVRQTQFTFYLVRENLMALAEGTVDKRLWLGRKPGLTTPGGAYLVFVANYHWHVAATPPVGLVELSSQNR